MKKAISLASIVCLWAAMITTTGCNGTTVAQDIDDIVVIASPQTLGGLRKHYGAGVAQRLCAEIAKDLAGHPTDDIVDAILAHAQRTQQEIKP